MRLTEIRAIAVGLHREGETREESLAAALKEAVDRIEKLEKAAREGGHLAEIPGDHVALCGATIQSVCDLCMRVACVRDRHRKRGAP